MLFSSMMVPRILPAAPAKMTLPFESRAANLFSPAVKSTPASRAYERPISLLVVMVQFLLLSISVFRAAATARREGTNRGGAWSGDRERKIADPRGQALSSGLGRL